MKKKQVLELAVLSTLAVTTMLTVVLAGCTPAEPKEDVNANVPAGAPPLMPTSHADRYATLGADGCYGCHGAGEEGNPMLKEATALPADHYKDGDANSFEMDGPHKQCNTCHVQA